MHKSTLTLAGLALCGTASIAFASGNSGDAKVRAIHASPDTPGVDVLVNDDAAFVNILFRDVTPYAKLPSDTYNFKVVPTGETMPVPIEADLFLESDTIYSIVALDKFDDIFPKVLIDDNTLSKTKARIRFLHASPTTPPVDIALADGGPVLFANVAFADDPMYIEVDPGTYNLEARLAGEPDPALPIGPVTVTANLVATAYAMGQLEGEGDQALQAVLSIDQTCPVDLTGNGKVNGYDLCKFWKWYCWGDPRADYTGNGRINCWDYWYFYWDYKAGKKDCNRIID
jgi:hypothetical protein